jgi:hypothetical protein
MKTVLLLLIFLLYSFTIYRLFKSYFLKLYEKNKILFWIYSLVINLLIPYTLLLLISTKINNFFLNTLHNGVQRNIKRGCHDIQ